MILQYRGQPWQIDPATATRTSDGFLLANGFLLDDEGDAVLDDEGYPVFHSFFLGRAEQTPTERGTK